MQRIYLDNNATTPLDPRVLQAMLSDLSGLPANPSSLHWFGQQARNRLSNARAQVASFFRAKPDEILFNSGGTEGLNFLLRGLKSPGHILTSSTEHSAIYQTLESLHPLGWDITYLPVGLFGAPLPEQIQTAIRPDTKAIVLSASNSETGVKIDLEAIAQIAHQRNIPLFIDAVSYIGKEPLPLHPGIGAIAISAHKFHGPKGIGALYLRSDLKFSSKMTGGSQEGSRRAGTENLAGILGLAEALQILQESQTEITAHISALRNHFEKELLQALPNLLIHGQGPRICNTSNIAFLGLDGETLLMQLDLAGLAVSHGSACSSGSIEPSRVLTNMGIDRKTARSSIRFSFSRMNTLQEVDLALHQIIPLIKTLRKKVNG